MENIETTEIVETAEAVETAEIAETAEAVESTEKEKKKPSFDLKKITFNLRTVTAVLCVLVALFSVLAFFAGRSTAMIGYRSNQVDQVKTAINNTEASIMDAQNQIAENEKEIENLKAELPNYQTALDEAEAQAAPVETALQEAELALDEVCTRSYYSSRYCSEDCEALHSAVSTAEAAYNEAYAVVTDCERDLRNCNSSIGNLEDDIEYLNKKITNYQADIEEMKDQIADLRAQSAGAWVGLICKVLGMVLTVGGLCLIAKVLFTEEKRRKNLLASCYAIAAGAVLFLILAMIENRISGASLILFVFVTPYIYTVLMMGMFAGILLKKTQKPVVYRTVAIVAAVLSAVMSAALTAISGSGFTVVIGYLFAAAMICLAFVIEPLVFTEYINIAKHIFLSFITCGIWMLVWIYHVTKNLNTVSGVEERKPRNELLLCMFLPFFYPYWNLKTAECVEAYGLEKGKTFSLQTLALVFSFICPLFASVLIQNKINVIVGKPE